MKYVYLILLATLIAGNAMARPAPEWPGIRKEIQVTADVLEARLRETFKDDMNVHSVKGRYLAQQGVLFDIHLSLPWFSIDTTNNGADVHIDADLNLEEIPRMVHDILAELQIAITPYQAGELEALRELRDEQKDIREEQRTLRAELRKLRREQVRERDEKAREGIREQIAQLELELEAAETAAESLSDDIEVLYKQLQEPPHDQKRQNSDAPDPNLAASIALCDAASTLRSLDSEKYVTVSLKQRSSMTYITFTMELVEDCRARRIDAVELLDKAWVYEDS